MPITQLAPGVWRCGSEFINWYLVEDAGHVTIVDAGLPGYRRQVDEALRAAGRTRADVVAVVLTHADPDHTGFAEWLRREERVPVLVHSADAEMARTAKPKRTEARPSPQLLRSRTLYRALREFATNGLPKKVGAVTTYEDGAELDVPGRPRVIHTPGHTDGHCALHFASHGVLFAGDAMSSVNVFSGARGPQLMPRFVTVSTRQALASLDRLEPIEAGVVGFGHGEPWREGVASAVQAARRAPQG